MISVLEKSKRIYEIGMFYVTYRPYSFLKKFTLHRKFKSWAAQEYQITYTRKELKQLYELIGGVLEDTENDKE